MKRRHFLRTFFAGIVAAPVVAKVLAEEPYRCVITPHVRTIKMRSVGPDYWFQTKRTTHCASEEYIRLIENACRNNPRLVAEAFYAKR